MTFPDSANAPTANNSAAPRSAFLHNACVNIKGNLRLIIIHAVLQFFGFPLFLISTARLVSSGRNRNVPNPLLQFSTLAFIALIALGIFIAVNCFKYLHNKSCVDMHLSLPLCRRKKFLSDYLSGLFIYISPFIVSMIFSALLLESLKSTMDGTQINYRTASGGWAMPFTCTVFGDISSGFYRLLAGVLVLMLTAYTLAVLITVLSGTLFETIAYNILVNLLLPASFSVIALSFIGDQYGFNAWYQLRFAAYKTSVLGGLNGITEELDYGISNILTGLMFFTALFFAAAFFAYMKRRAEQVSSPSAFKFRYLHHLCAVLVFINVAAAFVDSSTPGAFVSLIVITAFIYLVMEVISKRGFKGIGFGVLRYVLLAHVMCVFIYTASDGFGAVGRVPSHKNVLSVAISYEKALTPVKRPIHYVPHYVLNRGTYPRVNESQFIFTSDSEAVNAVINLHRQIAGDYVRFVNKDFVPGSPRTTEIHYPSPFVRSANLTVVYTLKGGRTMIREYRLVSEEGYNALRAFEFTDAYIEYVEKTVLFESLSIYDYYKEKEDYNSTPLRTKVYLDSGDREKEKTEFLLLSHDRDFYAGLANAVIADVKADAAARYTAHDSIFDIVLPALERDIPNVSGHTLYSTYSFRIPVYEHYQNTLSYLSLHEIEIPRLNEETEVIDDD